MINLLPESNIMLFDYSSTLFMRLSREVTSEFTILYLPDNKQKHTNLSFTGQSVPVETRAIISFSFLLSFVTTSSVPNRIRADVSGNALSSRKSFRSVKTNETIFFIFNFSSSYTFLYSNTFSANFEHCMDKFFSSFFFLSQILYIHL